ncbi:uncharacterized protein LOC142157958 [Mixophyes fleayi]|uniref:uncharacterized protein LOC142157958 n=1 Tax=Mixophyes fleayi TaxID=3061075 RepID=UPI003F4DDF69
MKIFLLVTLVAGILRHSQCCNPKPEGSNLAKGAHASQSSTVNTVKGLPQCAIDGNKDGNYFSGSCTHTNNDNNPWWRVDLRKSYKIDTIIVANRQDCCADRILGAEVRVGNSPDNNNPVCGVISGAGYITTLCCNGMEGRYVSVVIPGVQRHLTLCEVEVYEYKQEPLPSRVCCSLHYSVASRMDLLVALALLGFLGLAQSCPDEELGKNLARDGQVMQSSNAYDITNQPENAIDGNRNGDFWKNSCTHTFLEDDPWWRVDLGKSYKIGTIIVANRQDCCSNRILGAEVRVGNSPDNNNSLCGVISKNAYITTLCCNGMEGRYVSIVIPGEKKLMTLCEVEVYEEPVPNLPNTICCDAIMHCSQIEARMDLLVVLTLLGFHGLAQSCNPQEAATRANDGNKDTNLFHGSCSHTDQNYQPWWKLDLIQSYNIAKVVLSNRFDDMSQRLLCAEVRIGNSPDNNNPVCGVVLDVTNPTITFCCNGTGGRYVSVVIPARYEYLTLCEVEVYSVL